LLLADVSYVGEQVEPEVRPVGQIQRFQMRGKFTQFCEIPNILFGKDFIVVIFLVDFPEEPLPVPELGHVPFHEAEGEDLRDSGIDFVADFHAADGGVAAVGSQSPDEEGLSFPLHLDDDVVLVLGEAMDVEAHFLLPREEPDLLGLDKGDVGDDAGVFVLMYLAYILQSFILHPSLCLRPFTVRTSEHLPTVRRPFTTPGLGFASPWADIFRALIPLKEDVLKYLFWGR